MKNEDINKIYGKLKMKCFEMPNASYTNRYSDVHWDVPLKILSYNEMKRAWRKFSQKVMFKMRVLPIFIGITIEK